MILGFQPDEYPLYRPDRAAAEVGAARVVEELSALADAARHEAADATDEPTDTSDAADLTDSDERANERRDDQEAA